jgi:circadian clock protein KaiC
VLSAEILYRCAQRGIPGIFVSFEETKNSAITNANTLGWDLKKLEKEKKIALIDATLSPDVITSGEFTIQGLLSIINGEAKTIGAQLIVIDSIDVLLQLMNEPMRERKELNVLHYWLKDMKFTSILTLKNNTSGEQQNQYGYLEYMTDCVVFLEQRIFEQTTTRRLYVKKYRGSSYGSNQYPYFISERGIELMPITINKLDYQIPDKLLKTGIIRFDEVLGGGLKRGSTVLFVGSSGTGKTTLVSLISKNICARGERMLYISFEESPVSITANMRNVGIDLHPFMKQKILRLESMMPESMGVEHHLFRIMQLIEEFKPHHVAMDAISACKRLGSSQTFFDFLIRFIYYCKQRKITCLLNNLGPYIDININLSGIYMDSVIDTIVLLQDFPLQGEIHRLLLVKKSRGMNHSRHYWEYAITENGITIFDSKEINKKLPIDILLNSSSAQRGIV